MTTMTLKSVKTGLVRGLIAASLAVLVGIPSAAGASHLWSVVVHIEYPDGSVYEHAFATGLSTPELTSFLQACGSAHRFGSAVRFHCFPVPE